RLRLRSFEMLPKFVSYYFNTKLYWDAVVSGTSGSAQGGFNASKLAELQIPTPSLSEQKRVVAILEEVLAGLVTATANAEENLANARDIFKSYLDTTFIQSGIGWQESKLGDVCKFHGGSQPPKAKFSLDQKSDY